MSNKIFYFTGSGNSLAIARTIAERLENTKIVPVARHPGGFSGTDEERIGLVTPVYAWGLPRMVRDFARTCRPAPGQYVFGIAVSGGAPGKTLVQWAKLLRSNGASLSAGFAVRGDFSVRLPGMGDMGIVRLAERLAKGDSTATFSDRVEEIVKTIEAKARRAPETSNWKVNALGSFSYSAALSSFSKGDRGFRTGDACISCGICTRVCPRENVKLEGGRPVWHQDCEMCYACFFSCPERAIAYQGAEPSGPGFHPDIGLDDMMLR